MNERSPFDDHPPIDVSRFHPSVQERLLDADHALGQLEVAVMHSRNAFRETVASDDLEANAARIGEIVTLLGPIARIAQSLHATFAEFEAGLRKDDQQPT
ncbi:MAG: hypothetical protein M3Q31_23405 [Actinomycetota bacterium]|nr:hypothetical protein [Actinomycetota bacterium]